MTWTYSDWETYREEADVDAVSVPGLTFTFDGDLRAVAIVNLRGSLDGSTGNDGTYTIKSVSYTAGGTNQTTVAVVESFTDATADGTMTFPQTSALRLQRLRLHIVEVSNKIQASVGTDGTSYNAQVLAEYLKTLKAEESKLNPAMRGHFRGRLWRDNG